MTIEFDSQLYSGAAVRQAILDYGDIAQIICTPTDHGMQCTIVKSAYDMILTKLEFCNYVLSLSVSMDGSQL